MLKASIKKFVHCNIIAIKQFITCDYLYRVSALAFTTLLAIVPFVSIIVFFISTFPAFRRVVLIAESYILQNFIPSSGVQIQQYLQVFVEQAGRLPFVSIIFLFITSIFLINTIDDTLNDIWKAPKRRSAPWALVCYWIALLISPLVLGMSVFLSTYFFSIPWLALIGINSILLSSVPLVVNTIIFSLLYIIVPNKHVNWKLGFVGGFVAALIFEMMRRGFSTYMTHFANYQYIYGTFASIPIFLIWLYLCWLIILYGALLAHLLSKKPGASG